MMWAVCCTAFFGFFRLGELLEGSSSSCQGPTINEVATNSHDKPSMVMIHLRTSKTDQFSQGVDIYLGATGTNLCPVAALLAYVAVRKNSNRPLTIPLLPRRGPLPLAPTAPTPYRPQRRSRRGETRTQ